MEKKFNWIILLMSSAFMFAALPWVSFGFAMLLHTYTMLPFEDFVYSCGWWWWLALVFIDIVGLNLAVQQKRKGFIAFGVLLIFVILVAGVIWLALMGLLKHPPA